MGTGSALILLAIVEGEPSDPGRFDFRLPREATTVTFVNASDEQEARIEDISLQ